MGRRLFDSALAAAALACAVPSGVAMATTCTNPPPSLPGVAPLDAPISSSVGTGSHGADQIAAGAGHLAVTADHLAFSGYDAITVAAIGLGLILGGCLLLLAGQRRFRHNFVAAVAVRVVLTLGVVWGGFLVPVGHSAGAAGGSSGTSTLCSDVPPVAAPEVPYAIFLPIAVVAVGGVTLLVRRKGSQKRPSRRK